MILSHGRRYLFIHAPKTGGTSMALALEARALKDDVMLGDTPKARKRRRRVDRDRAAGRLWKHSTLADLDGIVSAAELDGLFVFTMVRNPWDRMVSYYHWLRAQTFDHSAVRLAQTQDFTGFVTAPQTTESFRRTPATAYVTDARGRMRADLFIRLEHWRQDSAPLAAHLGFRLDLPHANRSDRVADYRAAYTDTTRAAVADACAADIARFGYSFDPDR